MNARCLLPMLLVASAAGAADDAPRVPVEDFRVLMVAAIDSPRGEAHGLLVGDAAKALAQKLPGKGPVLIDVSTERHYKQAGCSRLNVRFSQEGVVLPGAKAPRRETLDLGINYCRDGGPPASLL